MLVPEREVILLQTGLYVDRKKNKYDQNVHGENVGSSCNPSKCSGEHTLSHSSTVPISSPEKSPRQQPNSAPPKLLVTTTNLRPTATLSPVLLAGDNNECLPDQSVGMAVTRDGQDDVGYGAGYRNRVNVQYPKPDDF